MKFQEDTKRFNSLSEYMVKCDCSHTVAMVSKDRIICHHCGKWIYRTPQIKFKYKMKEQMIKEERNDN